MTLTSTPTFEAPPPMSTAPSAQSEQLFYPHALGHGQALILLNLELTRLYRISSSA